MRAAINSEESKISALVVDDDTDLLELIAEELTNLGCVVLTARGGYEALEILLKEKIDIVISDVVMPEGSGIELIHEIKEKLDLMPPVIFITGKAEEVELESAYDSGVYAIIKKPFRVEDLFAKMQSLLATLNSRLSRENLRINTSLHIGLVCQKSGLKIPAARLGNIGRGGFFVEITEQFPDVGEPVAFVLSLASGSESKIEGNGIVRWVRKNKSPEGNPAGCGVEFTELSMESMQNIFNLALTDSLKTRTFIPKK